MTIELMKKAIVEYAKMFNSLFNMKFLGFTVGTFLVASVLIAIVLTVFLRKGD